MSKARNKEAKWARKRDRWKSQVLTIMAQGGTNVSALVEHEDVIRAGYIFAGKARPEKIKANHASICAHYSNIARWTGHAKQHKHKRPRDVAIIRTPEKAQQFYDSYEWRRARYEVLKRDGAKCALCNATRRSE